MPNRLLSRLAWTATGAAIALAPQLLRRVTNSRTNSDTPRRAPVREVETPEPTDAARPIQQLTRYRNPDGTHSILGTLLAEFTPGERTVPLVIAFCPPFEHLPTVDAEITDDSGAAVKVTQILHNGAQFEVRLPQPWDENLAVTVEMLATNTANAEFA